MDTLAKVQLRLPEDVHQWLVQWAAANDRSMNGQIVWSLRREMQREARKKKPPANA